MFPIFVNSFDGNCTKERHAKLFLVKRQCCNLYRYLWAENESIGKEIKIFAILKCKTSHKSVAK